MQGTLLKRMNRNRRRAVVAVQVGVTLTVMLGMVALAVDIGALYTAQAELQVSADAAALAGAAELAGDGDVQAAAIDAADHYAGLNKILGLTPKIYPEDVKFGQAVLGDDDRFHFEEHPDRWDAIHVTLQHLDYEDPNAPPGVSVPLTFAPVLGFSYQTLKAEAAAVLVPRDIAVVIDLSRSMLYDSSLMDWNRGDGGYANARDVWCTLDWNVPEPSKPYIPASASTIDQTEYEGYSGPAYGYMTSWGDPLTPGLYSASSDSGMWYIRRYYTTNESALDSKLAATGYNNSEIESLCYSGNDSDWGAFRNRCGVLLGLAEWRSGITDGGTPPAFPGGGDGDSKVEDWEVTWAAAPDYAVGWDWKDFIHYQQGNGSYVTFRYYYGPKSLVNFLCMDAPYYEDGGQLSTILWRTPQQPLRAVKDAVYALTEAIYDQDSLDRMSLELYTGHGWHAEDLSENIWNPSNKLYLYQAGHNDLYTNIGGGLFQAIHHLQYGENARSAAAKVIVLMSDGVPNRRDDRSSLADIDELDPPENNPEYWSNNSEYAEDMARIAAKNNMRIYTVSVGYGADENLMAEIAELANGEHFHAEGNPLEYHAELQDIFRKLGGKRPVTLIE